VDVLLKDADDKKVLDKIWLSGMVTAEVTEGLITVDPETHKLIPVIGTL
jgi:hypothetical protein